MKYPEIKAIARQLRNNPTDSEKILWKVIQNRRFLNLKFLRQHPLYYDHTYNNEHFFFIPDFYCADLKLIIELDGQIHNYTIEKDTHREMILKERGFNILRIKNEELENIDQVKNKIQHFINEKCNKSSR